MCYDLAQLAQRAYKAAIRENAPADVVEHYKREYEKFLPETHQFYHVSGFSHPRLLTIHKDGLALDTWGLIPHWVKDENQAQDIWNKTINARGETIFEKPAFRDAAKLSRCIIPVDGFFEHYHKGGKAYPYYIHASNNDPLMLGGIQAKWLNKETGEIIPTVSIVTTHGNELLSKIHNNPKIKEPRMPLILNNEDHNKWLNGSIEEAKQLIRTNMTIDLEAYTVHPIRGKHALGNSEEVLKEYLYDELLESD